MSPEICHRKSFVICGLKTEVVLLLSFSLCLFLGHSARLAAQTACEIHGRVTDLQGLTITGATLTLSGEPLAESIKTASDSEGSYRIAALTAGTYSLRVSKSGFATKIYQGLTVTVNRSVVFNVELPVSAMRQAITVSAKPPLIQASSSSTGATILPREIGQMPINGRNYLDLMQLVPGVTVNQQKDPGTDAAAPILGERGGNAAFLIDGMPNSNEVDGGRQLRSTRIRFWSFKCSPWAIKRSSATARVGL